jgi:Reverse transcriptase (RNA-dependent DNA polymerase)
MVIDELLTELTEQGYEVIGFADDLVIMIRGNDDSILSNRLQSALNHAMKWCKDANLSINPMKTVVIPFTRRLKHNLKEPRMGDVTIKFSEDIKYLGITLDSKLLWNSHMKKTKEKAIMALMACRRVVGQRWGLKPAMMRWIYLMVVRPMVSYASSVWWRKSGEATTGAMLQKIQRLACLLTTGAMKSAPTTALEAMLDLPSCVNQTTSPGALEYYTDGSRKNGLVGMGIYGPSIRYFEALGSPPP